MVFSIKVPSDLPESEHQRQKERRRSLWREERPKSKSVHMGACWPDLYRFEKLLTRPKIQQDFDPTLTKPASFILLRAVKSCIKTDPFQIELAINV
jgi:hypothetical protein